MCHTGMTKSTNQKPRQLHGGHVVFGNLMLHNFKGLGMIFLLFSAYFIMSEEWCKFVQILEKEDWEFRRAMQEEVSIVSILLNLVVNNQLLAGAGIITQHKKELLNFK